MTTIPSLSDKSPAYRTFFQDKELKMNYPQLMDSAIQAIDKLNTQHIDIEEEEEEMTSESSPEQDNTFTNPDLLKKQSLELCTDDFSNWIKDHLNKKRMNRIWPKLDPEDKGYIESVDKLSDGIAFIAKLYKMKLYQNNVIKEEPKSEEIQKQAEQIALWIARSYGSMVQSEISLSPKQYIFRVSKREFRTNLYKWIRDYAGADGTT